MAVATIVTSPVRANDLRISLDELFQVIKAKMAKDVKKQRLTKACSEG
jgi:hypothetical protein